VIFRSSRFRLVARLFAILLLTWTTADLCGHGVCSHDREPIVPWSSPAPGTRTAMGRPGEALPDAAAFDGPDDCFCCCHCIEVQVRFELPVGYSFVSMVLVEHPALPFSIPSRLDHPPHA